MPNNIKHIGALTGIILTFSGVAAASLHYKHNKHKKCESYRDLAELFAGEKIQKINNPSSNGSAYFVGKDKVFKTCDTVNDCFHETAEMKKYQKFGLYPRIIITCASHGSAVGYVMERLTGSTLANVVSNDTFDVDVVIDDLVQLYQKIKNVPGFKHNDLHVNNIMYHSRPGEKKRLFIIDPHVDDEHSTSEDLQLAINFLNVIGMYNFKYEMLDLRRVTLDSVEEAVTNKVELTVWQRCYVLFFLYLKRHKCNVDIAISKFVDMHSLYSGTDSDGGLAGLFAQYLGNVEDDKKIQEAFTFLLFFAVFRNRSEVVNLVVAPALVKTIQMKYPGIEDCLHSFVCTGEVKNM